MAKYNTIYPMPGGVESYHETILEIVRHVDAEAPHRDALATWMLEEYEGMESEESADRRIQFLKQAGILTQQADQMLVDDGGYTLLGGVETGDALYKLLNDRFIAIELVLQLADTHATVDEIHDAVVDETGADWGETHQIQHRLRYLRSIGYIEHAGGSHAVTAAGYRALRDELDTKPEYGPPPSPHQLIAQLQDEATVSCEFYWIEFDSASGTLRDYIQPSTSLANGLSPESITPDDVLFHFVDGEIAGYSALREPGTITTDDTGTERYRAPVHFHAFPDPIPLHEVIAPLTTETNFPASEFNAETYPFSPTGLHSVPLGKLPPTAARIIIDAGGDFRTYGDINLELELAPEQIPDADKIALHFPGDAFDRILAEVKEAILNDRNIIFIGPPGTGKTELATALADSLTANKGYTLVTATADWSTFDTVGGYQPDRESKLEFIPGVFLSRFQDSNQEPQNEWLIIDEINRANIDKAFGTFFSALAGDTVTTSFKTQHGDEVTIVGDSDETLPIRPHRYYIPQTWRLLATMNTHDKMTLYDMSYAFMRRFAFIHVGAPAPDQIDSPLIKEYLDIWKVSITGETAEESPDSEGHTVSQSAVDALVAFWSTLQQDRELGPALIRNIALALSRQDGSEPDLTSPLKMYVLPQLEDLPEPEQIRAVRGLLNNDDVPMDRDQLRIFASDYFSIDQDRLTEKT